MNQANSLPIACRRPTDFTTTEVSLYKRLRVVLCDVHCMSYAILV